MYLNVFCTTFFSVISGIKSLFIFIHINIKAVDEKLKLNLVFIYFAKLAKKT